jgi:enoyl-CoA hydratase
VSPDFIVDRPDQSTLHLSTFLARDYDERDELSCGWVILQGNSDLSIRGSHMYRSNQAREVIRLLSERCIVMEQGDLEITTLDGLPEVQQKMLEGRMTKPKGVALVQAGRAGLTVGEYESMYVGMRSRVADPARNQYLSVHWSDGVAVVTIERPDALNALSLDLLNQIESVVTEVAATRTVDGQPVRSLLLRGSGRAFMAGADITDFVGASPEAIAALAAKVMDVYDRLERLPVPVVALVDGFALGGGNELAMSAHYRVVTENAVMGQPEIKLGTIPGYGGMQRLPRLVGPRKAAELALNGEPVGGRKAVELGLADSFFAAATALREAFRMAQELASGKRAAPRRSWDAIATAQKNELEELMRSPEIAGLLSAAAPDTATASDLKSARRYAAGVALEALRTGYEKGFVAGLKNDARLFGEVTSSPSGQHWVQRFLDKDPRQSAFLTLLAPR